MKLSKKGERITFVLVGLLLLILVISFYKISITGAVLGLPAEDSFVEDSLNESLNDSEISDLENNSGINNSKETNLNDPSLDYQLNLSIQPDVSSEPIVDSSAGNLGVSVVPQIQNSGSLTTSALSIQATNIDSCTTITTSGRYILTNSSIVNYNGDCIIIGTKTNDTEIDCQGFKLDGDDAGFDFGIQINSTNSNITVKDCVFNDFNVGIILVDTATNSTFINITTNSTSAYGIDVGSGSTNNNFNNIFINNSGTAGIRFTNVDQSVLTNINVSFCPDGISLNSGSDSNNFSNGTISYNTDEGIDLQNSDSNIINGFNFSSNTDFDLQIPSSSTSNLIYNNKFLNPNETNLGASTSTVFFVSNYSGTNVLGNSSIGGNYWGIFTGPDSNRDGISDAGFIYFFTSTTLIDLYPLLDTANITANVSSNGTYIHKEGSYLLGPSVNGIVYQGGNNTLLSCGSYGASGITIDDQTSTTKYITNASLNSCYINKSILTITSVNNSVFSNIFVNNTYIALSTSSYNNFTNITVINQNGTNSTYALGLETSSRFNRITNVTLYNDSTGIYIASNNNTFINITSRNNTYYGFDIHAAGSNNISNAIVDGNSRGFFIESTSTYNYIFDSNITRNAFGLYFLSTSDVYNTVYNNYINNTNNLLMDTSTNYNNFSTNNVAGTNIIKGTIIGGNYWSNFSGPDFDANGISDTSYQLGTYSYDYFPLLDAYNTNNSISCSSFTTSGRYNISTNVTSAGGTCFEIRTSNVFLDCKSYYVTGSGSGYGLAINSSNLQNISISNCFIQNFTYGFYSNSTISAVIANSTFYNNTNGLLIEQSSNLNLSYNNIYNNTKGIYLYKTNSTNISRSNIYNNTNGIQFTEDSYNNLIYINNITQNDYGIFNVTRNSNFSDNNFNNRLFNIYWPDSGLTYYLEAERNWWGSSNCSLVSENITSDAKVDFDPVLDNLFPSGSSTACNVFCNMSIFDSKTLSSSLEGCTHYGIKIYPSTSTNVTLNCNKNSITGSGSAVYGIYVNGSADNTTIVNCTISNFDYGIYSGSDPISGQATPSGVNNFNYSNNTFINNTNGIYVAVGNGSFIRNKFTGGSNKNGLYLDYANNGVGSVYIIENNTFDSLYRGIYLLQDTYIYETNSYIRYNNFTNNTFGFHVGGKIISSTAGHNFFFNNTYSYYITQPTTSLNADPYFYITNERIYNSQNAILLNASNSLTTGNSWGNIIFSGNTYDLNVIEGGTLAYIIYNSSINKSRLSVSTDDELQIKWPVYINVTDSNGNQISNVTITVSDSVNTLLDSNSTNNGFYTAKVKEFYKTNGINYYVVPATVVVEKNNYTQSSTSVNLLNQTYSRVNLTINSVGCGDTITSNITLGNDYLCASNGLIVGADNVVINGSGYRIIGSGSGTGINLNGKNNVKIMNLNVTNFSTGISFPSGSDNSNISKVYIINNTNGVALTDSNNNLFTNTIFNRNTADASSTSSSATNNSLINSTFNINLVSASSSAEIHVKWFVDVTAIFNSSTAPIPEATLKGLFNSSLIIDDQLTTGSTGNSTLTLTEYKKTSSGINYLTPHLINLSFYFSGTTYSNSTVINLTTTNSTSRTLSLPLGCSTPEKLTTISSSTIFCPGDYEASVTIDSSNVVLSCVDTTLITWYPAAILPGGTTIPTNIGIQIDSLNNVTISGCTLVGMPYEYHTSGIWIGGSNNITLNDISIYGAAPKGVYCQNSNRININSSSFGIAPSGVEVVTRSFSQGTSYHIYLSGCNNSIINENNLSGYGLNFLGSFSNNITNNSFGDAEKAVYFSSGSSSNNLLYQNYFYSDNTKYFYNEDSLSLDTNNNFSKQNGSYYIGNTYQSYCDKGSDLNSDGYADTVSSSGNDWPMNSTVDSKMTGAIDYGPKIQTCPAENVFLGSSSSSSGSSDSGGGGSLPAAVSEGPTEEAVAPSSSDYTAAEAAKYLQVNLFSKNFNVFTTVTLTLENTGTKTMRLFPELLQETEDPFFIVTRKTLGAEGSFMEKLASLFYSKNTITGRLLKAEIVNPEQIVLGPGEKIEKTLQIKEGLVPHQIKIQFNTFGEKVLEKEVESQKKEFSGTAVDVDANKKLMDVYAILVPEESVGKFEQYYANQAVNALTGAAISDIFASQPDSYTLEININDFQTNKTLFADLYGPYVLKEKQTFVFAQQFKYKERYNGKYFLTSKIYKKNKVLVENKFDVELN